MRNLEDDIERYEGRYHGHQNRQSAVRAPEPRREDNSSRKSGRGFLKGALAALLVVVVSLYVNTNLRKEVMGVFDRVSLPRAKVEKRVGTGVVSVTPAAQTDTTDVTTVRAPVVGLLGNFSAFRNAEWVTGRGRVLTVLKDDLHPPRHQRFILIDGKGHTVLIAHNIDIASRLDNLKEGDVVEFKGEFRINDKGGVIHWTHRDPAGRRPGGWLRRAN